MGTAGNITSGRKLNLARSVSTLSPDAEQDGGQTIEWKRVILSFNSFVCIILCLPFDLATETARGVQHLLSQHRHIKIEDGADYKQKNPVKPSLFRPTQSNQEIIINECVVF